MPFPPFPVLPDNDPLTALKNLRSFLREVVHAIPAFFIFTGIVLFLVLVFAIASVCFGFEIALLWAADLVPFTFAVISVVVSVKTLRDEHHNIVIAFVLLLGFAGTVVIHYTKARADAQYHAELDRLDGKVDFVSDQNNRLLTAYLAKPAITAQEAEMQRRRGIEIALRSEYILHHENVPPGLLAGTEFPPSDWVNKRLVELGEKWKVEDTPAVKPVLQAVQPEKRSHLEASFHPVSVKLWPITKKYIPSENGKVEISLTFMPKDNLAKNVSVWLRLCTACSYAREPDKFQNIPGHAEPSERVMKVGDLYPNVAFEPITFAVVPPPEPSDGFKIALFFACENCDPTDPYAESVWLTVYTKRGFLSE